MSWQQVRELRKSGDLTGARKLGQELLEWNSGDYRVSWELEWVFYEEIKAAVVRIVAEAETNRTPQRKDLDAIDAALNDFVKLPAPQVPGMACSNMLLQLCKVADRFSRFAAFLDWVGPERLRSEDWEPNRFGDREFAPLGVRIARSLVKWIKSRHDVPPTRIEQALKWLSLAKEKAAGDDVLWLEWDRVAVLRLAGEHAAAAEVLSTVIKAKRNEFWVWAEAGQLYREDDPDLAIACYCRALECRSDPGFTINVNRQLAELLCEAGLHAQASREISTAIEIRIRNKWSLGKELEALAASSWYDPEASGAQDSREFYRSHSARALELCFDRIERRPATYVGVVEAKPRRGSPDNAQPRTHPRFAIRDCDGNSVTMLGPHQRRIDWTKGQPLTLYLGFHEGGRHPTVVHSAARDDGAGWDCTEATRGLVVSDAVENRTVLWVHLDRNSSARLSPDDWRGDGLPAAGDAVECRTVWNPKMERSEIVSATRGDTFPPDGMTLRGTLRRHEKGFGFVDEVFVPPQLVSRLQPDIENVDVIAVYGPKPGTDMYSWRAIRVD